ncbi:ABC transporter substrate-binding protein [Domibacillus enclensis]|uniref:ABC transporter substrate-binding protein n=1 Tax=Domibacillus enclensis TaxID=1017273 RepID=A0A1N7AFT6_9BACI|nr:ABC transporter substrate-binding protein [Domibacillus enclensis]OXS75804.1 ABC transporter substrate-binding protein [Domibacillus enclensis]SIR37874.1 carbohydrate ABC transporter substrate-binding protein, CUT1 family [Domibacillus enclensis]
MKTKWKKTSAAFIMGTVLMMAGCQGDDSANTKEESTGPVTFSMFNADPHSQWDNMESPVSQIVKEKTEVTLEPEFDVAGGEQKIPLMIASGEYPDLIAPKGNAGKLVDAGALIDLTDLIEEHAPNLQKIYGDYFSRLKWSGEDESIYILPTAAVDHTYWAPGTGFMLQHDVVKQLGYPEIRTVKDFENAIREYKEKNPTIDGQPTIGLSLLADDWRIMISTTNPAFYATGAPDDGEFYIDPDTHEATMHYRRPAEKEYFKWLNHMNAEGLLDKESFVQKYDQYLAKISSGRTIGLIDTDWEVADAQRALRESGKAERMHGMYPVTLTEEYKHANFQDTGYLGGWGIGITVDCEDPIRAIKFLDYLASEEGQILQNWGIEGEHYTIEDGKRVISDEEMNERNNNANYVKETGIGVLKGFAPIYGDGVTDSTGQTYSIASPDQIKNAYTDVEKEVLANYDVEMWKDLYPQKEEFPVKPWGAAYNMPVEAGSDLELIMQKSMDIVKKRIPEAILADPAEFDAVWDEFMADLEKAGVEQAEADYTEMVKNRVELWK